jgi:hypothetical protein
MTNSKSDQPMKRNLLKMLALLPWVAGCSVTGRPAVPVEASQKRFQGIGLVLVVDAVPGAEMNGVVLYNDRGVEIYGTSRVARGRRDIWALSSARVPLTVRAEWGEGRQFGLSKTPSWYGGTILGDYTIPVAERIPDEVLNDIRAHGGGLRLKFRLKPDGVLFGWDIERSAPLGDVSIFEMPGGDFLETRY